MASIPSSGGCPFSHGNNPMSKPPAPEGNAPVPENNPQNPNGQRPLTPEEQDLLDSTIKAMGLTPEQEKFVRENMDPATLATILGQNKV